MNERRPLLVAGRTLKDYTALNADIEQDFVVELCIACEKGVVLSPEGKAKLEEAKKDPRFHPCGAICTACAILLMPPGSEITQSAHGRQQERTNPHVKSTIDMLRRRR
jgi:hypothetical protein